MIGQTISHYRILEKLGQGGMGVVYKAEDTHLNRRVAIKFLSPELSRQPEAKARFIHEAQAASSLEHHNICTIHEIGQEDDQLYVVMTCYEGQTLRDRMGRGRLKVQEAVEITIQIAQGLTKAHHKGIIHRDIKPSNVFITGDGIVKIIDFGLAKLADHTRVTRAGTTLGTVAYMSPEQARGEDVDPRSDIWSLGVILYEMLSGRLPFAGGHEQALIYAILNERPSPIRQALPLVLVEVERVLSRALQKDPCQRYPSAEEMLEDLKSCQEALRPESKRQRGLAHRWRCLLQLRVAIPTIAILAGLLLAGHAWFERRAKFRWAEQEALPRIADVTMGDLSQRTEAYPLALEVEKILPEHPILTEYFARASARIDITSNPPGASVHFKSYDSPGSEWQRIGTTPLEDVRLPLGFFRWKMEKSGYDEVYAVAPNFKLDLSLRELWRPRNLHRHLVPEGRTPAGMVSVAGGESDVGPLGDFFIDRYEVTNRQFKEFVDAGGYRDGQYWRHEFVKDGDVMTWEQAMAGLIDKTGRNGPSIWVAGDYPDSRGDFPVTGISWYEAAAYAEFAGKSLPSGYHWGLAKGPWWMFFSALLVSHSNCGGEGLEMVGANEGMTAHGEYDLAGNAREWCWNRTPQGRLVRGGAWDDNAYMTGNWSQASAFDRSAKTGFRCVLYLDEEKIPAAAFEPVLVTDRPNLRDRAPVPDEVFEAYRARFSYDRTDLNPETEWRDESADDWIQERVSFDAAHGGERIPANLFLPKNVSPPFQAVLY
ncbi:MAG: bifunctional serine/threonine-protein kinase/formylglycine-generating enzyme family protein, partial [bacterium]